MIETFQGMLIWNHEIDLYLLVDVLVDLPNVSLFGDNKFKQISENGNRRRTFNPFTPPKIALMFQQQQQRRY